MKKIPKTMWLALALTALSLSSVSQTTQPNWKLAINGQSGQAPILRVNGKSYVDIEDLARIINGSLTLHGDQVTLTLPAAAGSGQTTDSSVPTQPPAPGFSKEFMKAGIEAMSVIREWRTALVSAVQNGAVLTDGVFAPYRLQAAKNVRLASVAASTDADRGASQLVSNELGNMQKLNDKIMAARKDMQYLSPDAVNDDPLDQQILTCARALAAMAANNQFQDDGSCH